jgi:hypothetical protein
VAIKKLLAGLALISSSLMGAHAGANSAAPEVVYQGFDGAVSADIKAAADQRFGDYVSALKNRDYQSAYQMLRLSYQASHPRLEWEMQLRGRDGLWADGAMRILRVSWYKDPDGQPSGLYAAYDFRGDRTDGGMDCGYVVVHKTNEAAGFSVVRTDTSFVPAALMKEGVPDVAVLRELPCFLGNGIATAL